MDEFKNSIDINKFRSTNEIWNQLALNDPWSVGYVSTLIESKQFQTKEEWEDFYYASGADRLVQIAKLSSSAQTLLKTHLVKTLSAYQVSTLSQTEVALNKSYGRTKDEIAEKGKILFAELNRLKINNYNITEAECIEAVRFRVVCETWNGIFVREHNTIASLNKTIPGITLEKTTGAEDYKYAVDYKIVNTGKVVGGLQIKPPSYFRSSSYLQTAQRANDAKHALFQQDFGCPTFYINSKADGQILNPENIEKIKALL